MRCPSMLAVALFFCMLFLTQCAGNEGHFLETLSGFFRGNTHKDFTDYNIDEKREYRRYKFYKKSVADEREKEILRRMKTSATTQ